MVREIDISGETCEFLFRDGAKGFIYSRDLSWQDLLNTYSRIILLEQYNIKKAENPPKDFRLLINRLGRRQVKIALL